MATQIWNSETAARSGHTHPEYALVQHEHTVDGLSHTHKPQIAVQPTAPTSPERGDLWVPATI